MSKASTDHPLSNKQQAHAARIATQRLARQRQQQREQVKRLGIWGIGVVVALAIIILIVHAATPAAATGNGTISGVITYANLSRDHTTGPVTYTTNPPVGGAHSPVWANCGIYDQPLINENAVHSLEHGAVWVTYLPGASATTVATLRDLVRGHDHALLSPYPNQPSPIIITAWGAQLKVTSATDARLTQFLQHYENSPHAPEQNGECTGGIGTPLNG